MSDPTQRHHHAEICRQSRARRASGGGHSIRTAAEKAALLSRSIEELSYKEKECVRYYKRQERKKQNIATLNIAPPPSAVAPLSAYSPSPSLSAEADPAPPSFHPPPVSDMPPLHEDIVPLNTQDLNDILGYTYHSPSPVIPPSISPSPCVPLPCPSSPPPPVVTTMASYSTAAAMCSASKLRQSRKRKNMSILNPNEKRREPLTGVKIGTQYREDQDEENEDEADKENEEQQWETLIKERSEHMLARYKVSHAKDHVTDEYHRARITANVRLWVNTARNKGCTGTEDGGLHAPGGCPGPFTPSSFIDHTQFAHWKKYKRSEGNKRDKVYNMIMDSSTAKFAKCMTGPEAHGRVLWVQCHHAESRQQIKNK